MDFLQELYQQGLTYSGINTARTTLSAFITLEGNFSVGVHPMVQRFMKGVFQTRPALPRYQATWDTSVVLSYLKALHPVEELNLQQLTYKLVMLCALVTGQRSQSIHLMNLSTLQKKTDSYVFHIDKATISRWIRTVMKAAGINTDIFKPHSTRAASTSKAQSCDVPINSILKAASWNTGGPGARRVQLYIVYARIYSILLKIM